MPILYSYKSKFGYNIETKVSTDTIPASKEPTPNDTMTTYHADKRVANATETADAISQIDLSPDQVLVYVETALEEYLRDYKFDNSETKYVMKVVKDSQISLAPDPTGTKLSYGLQRTRYILHAGFKPPHFVKFVYQWTQNGRTFLTSPYYLSTTQPGASVPCTKPIDLTDSLHASDPIAAIILELQQLNSVSPPIPGTNHTLSGPDFQWIYTGGFGVKFSVSSSSRLYWQDVDGTTGEVKQTNRVARSLQLKLVQITENKINVFCYVLVFLLFSLCHLLILFL